METKLSDYATGKTKYVKMFSVALSRIPSMYDELGSYIEKNWIWNPISGQTTEDLWDMYQSIF